MNRSPWLLLALTAAVICFQSGESEGQITGDLRRAPAELGKGRLQGELNVQRARIDEQRVQRQTEVIRLEQIIDRFQSRVTRLERQMLSMTRLPVISIAEAQAAVEYADAQLRESEQLHEKGEISDVQIAGDRLEVARAGGQLDAAKAAHADGLIALELDVLYAERHLYEQTQEKSQMERFVAKGYTSSDGLRLRILDVALAEKQLQLARLRLQSLQKSAGEKKSEPKSD